MMTREIIRIDIDQIVEIGEFYLVVEFSVDKILEIDWDMNRIIGMILGQVILEVMWECIIIIIRIIEDRIKEVNIEKTIGMKIIEEIEVGPEKDDFQIIMTEGVIEAQEKVYLDQVQDWVLIEKG